MKLLYAILGFTLGIIFMTTDKYIIANSAELKYARNITAFNSAKLACIRATDADWNKCWYISNRIFEELSNE